MGEKRYPLLNKRTKERFSVPLREVRQYLNVTEPATGRPLYEALSDLPGVAFGTDNVERVMVPKERVRDAIAPNSNLALLSGDDDPVIEQARRSAIDRAKQQVAANRSGFAVAADSALSTVTFGQTSRLANFLAGEGAEEARLRQIDEHAFSHFGGRALGWLALGLLPIPGLGKASVGATQSIRGGSVFELGAKAQSLVRGSIAGKGFLPEFARRVAGPVTFAAVAETPLAAATVAADIVDHDKELAADIFAGDMLTQIGLAVGIAGVTSLGFAAIGAGVKSAGGAIAKRGARNEMLDAVLQGANRHIFRPHRSKSVLFDIGESRMRQVLSKVSRNAETSATQTKLGRLLGGSIADDWINLNYTWRLLLRDLASAPTARKFKRAVVTARKNISDPRFQEPLGWLENHADDVFAARRQAGELILDSRNFADTYLKQEIRYPVGIASAAADDAAKLIDDALLAGGLEPLGAGAGNFGVRLQKAIQARRSITDPDKLSKMDNLLGEAFPGRADQLKGYLAAVSNADRAAQEVLRITSDLGTDATRMFDIGDLLEFQMPGGGTSGVRASVKSLEGSVRNLVDDKVRMLKVKPFKEAGVFDDGMNSLVQNKFNGLEEGLGGMVKANTILADLNNNLVPFARVSKPMSHDEILAAQVGAVMTTKQRVFHTLQYIALASGGARHTATFGGVYVFRELPSLDEKRAAFRMVHDAVRANGHSVDAMVAYGGDLADPAAQFDLDLGVALAGTQMAVMGYLNTQMPESADPRIAPEEMPTAEIENFLEAVGALMDPVSVLATAIDGSTLGQAVDAIRTVYPKLYTDMVIDVAEFVAEYGDMMGHAQLLGLDTFTGYALGYSDGPGPELTMQSPFAQTAQQAQSIGNIGGFENRQMNFALTSTPAQKVSSL